MTYPVTYPAHPDHYFTVSRLFLMNGQHVWGDLSDGPLASFDAATDCVLESFDGDEMHLRIETVRVVEHDGNVSIDRTDDAIACLVIGRRCLPTAGGDLKNTTCVFYSGTDAAEEWEAA